MVNANDEARRVLVLGAGGSIGSQLVIELLAQGYSVTALVRSLPSAIRIGRYPITIVQEDLLLTDKDVLCGHMQNHDVVIDCTYSVNPEYDARVKESRALASLICAAAIKSKVKKLIHYGTISVYPVDVSKVSELTVCEPRGDSYADSKLAAEKVFLEQSPSDITISILQLPVVYGPFMQWSCAPISAMSEMTLLMPKGLNGRCTPLYVDDVVAATLVAIESRKCWVEKFLLRGAQDMSWDDYYGAHADLSEALNLEFVSREKITLLHREKRKANEPWVRLKAAFSDDGDFRQLILSQWGIRSIYKWVKQFRGQQGMDNIKSRLAKNVIEKKAQQVSVLGSNNLELFDTMPAIESDKMVNVLGFTPQVSFSEGLEKTSQWMRWARVIK